jgi:hypothetical protein
MAIAQAAGRNGVLPIAQCRFSTPRADFLIRRHAHLTRASIVFRKKLDCRIKSGNDGQTILPR